jgi:squalene-hopene/tetraprenyl-beta-curcumene cyclase
MTLIVDNTPRVETLPRSQHDQGILEAWNVVYQSLTRQQTGCNWTGELSTSALSTATAISALVQVRKHDCVPTSVAALVNKAIADGCAWLAQHQNADGGFGDTDRSHSNIATTLLVLAAWELAGSLSSCQSPKHQISKDQIPNNQGHPKFWADRNLQATMRSKQHLAWQYVNACGRWDGLRRRYGTDKTFVVPILSNCALAGFVDWSEVAALPFEAAWLPQDLYRWASMPVVSYAIPALVAIGQARFHKRPPSNRALRWLRRKALQPTLGVLRKMQPASGGYLEAVPLTSFVLMNLATVGNASLPVAQECLRFILDSRLEDGSWPIDTNLATWLTSLSITAIARKSEPKLSILPPATTSLAAPASELTDASILSNTNRSASTTDGTVAISSSKNHCDAAISANTVRWLLRCQHTQRHPFTGATPGGWGWTNLSGAVPDADDTPAALLALAAFDLGRPDLQRLAHEVEHAVGSGLRWLIRLQNRDGGWPTFCRGWGKLPFDRSGTDLTAHALRAIHAWSPRLERLRSVNTATPAEHVLRRASLRGLAYLSRTQQPDGSWLPLWFGNQDRSAEDNPIYGTGRVLLAYAALDNLGCAQADRGIEYLRENQNADGGWGGGPVHAAHPQNASRNAQQARQIAQSKEIAENITICSSVEETSIALEGLIQCGGDLSRDASIMRGLACLINMVERGETRQASPIGFYFAKLWYYERLYPAIFSLSALGAALNKLGQNDKV